MNIKKGDNVVVISGADRGKTGKVLRALPKESRVIIEGVNVKKRHERSRRGNQKGQIIEKTLPVHISNVMLTDPKGGARTRLKIDRTSGKRVRIAKKSGAVIEK